jgi:hypothetical protein
MDESLEKVIQTIEKHTNGYYHGLSRHGADTNLGTRITLGCQLIFGVSNTDPMTSDVKFYKNEIIAELENHYPRPTFIPFPYTDKETLIKVLQGLSDEYDADLDIKRLIRDIKFNDDRPTYIIITIINYPIILPVNTD